MRKTGVYQALGDVNYFIPHALPPTNPALVLNAEVLSLYGEASFALGQLNEMSLRLPDPERFIKAYVIKEALLSSAIEGIHTTLIEVYTQPVVGVKPNKDTRLVLNYTKALEAALNQLQTEGLPLVSRVILRAHEVLLADGESGAANPGHFRLQSVKVGELVPPPAPEIPRLMQELERYINEASDLPPLIKAGLVHVQFETMHPFLDGNGRIGRLLIVLMLIDNKLLRLPVLYPSYYFKKHHAEYYQCLDRVRTDGDFEGWIVYYLKAIRDSAIDAHARAKDIEALEQQLNALVLNDVGFTKMRETAKAALNYLFERPITNIAEMSQALGKAYNTIQKILNVFIALNLVSETIVNKRNKVYRFERYLHLLEKSYS